MKVILYAALTLNGLIAKEDGNTDFLSKEDFIHFNSICNQTKTVIFGRKSWDEMNPNWLPFKEGDGTYVILTRNKSLTSQNPKTIYSSATPAEIIALLAKSGSSEVCIAGGREIFSLFLGTGVVDELYIDLEPLVFGKGIHFLTEVDLEQNFKLLAVSKLSDQTIQLHYQVIK